MPQATFSIILPVRNGGSHVKLCVESILAQTLESFNLIVLDNCSTDGTSEWLASLKDERIQIIPSGKSLTIEENWSRIRHIEKNEFITLIGHDDILLPDYLETMQQLIAAHPEASLYQSHFTYIDSNGNALRPCKPMAAVENDAALLQSFLTGNIDIMGTGFMTRAKDYDAVGGIPAAYPNLLFADMELWLRLTMKGYKATTQQCCFSYRIHQSTTKTTADEKLQLAFEKFIYFLTEIKSTNTGLSKVIAANGITFIHHHCKSLSHRLLRTPQSQRGHVSVSSLIKKCEAYSEMLVPGSNYQPATDKKILLAKWIDSNSLLQRLFLLFKKIVPGPVYH
jgi:glycosyltransferase involved in cell wall biosynthesis